MNNINIKNNKRQRCEIWTRTMGYYRPVSFYNDGKKSEFYSRKFFVEDICLNNKKFNEQYS